VRLSDAKYGASPCVGSVVLPTQNCHAVCAKKRRSLRPTFSVGREAQAAWPARSDGPTLQRGGVAVRDPDHSVSESDILKELMAYLRKSGSL